MNKSELQKHIAEVYSTAPDFPWENTPEVVRSCDDDTQDAVRYPFRWNG